MPVRLDRNWRRFAATTLTALDLLLAACGGGDPASAAASATPDSVEPSANATAAGDAGTTVAATSAGITPQGDVASDRVVAQAQGAAAPPVTPPVRPPARSTGTLLLRIDGPDAGVSHDVLHIAGSADLAGTLRLEFGDAYTPAAGQRFTVITADKGITGQRLSVSNNKALPLTLSQDAQNVYATVGR